MCCFFYTYSSILKNAVLAADLLRMNINCGIAILASDILSFFPLFTKCLKAFPHVYSCVLCDDECFFFCSISKRKAAVYLTYSWTDCRGLRQLGLLHGACVGREPCYLDAVDCATLLLIVRPVSFTQPSCCWPCSGKLSCLLLSCILSSFSDWPQSLPKNKIIQRQIYKDVIPVNVPPKRH